MTVRWIEESVTGVRWLGDLGDLGRPKNVHARTVLAAWNKSQHFIMAGYPSLDDMMQESWTYRDRRMLGSFVIWWNNTANQPLANWGQSLLPPPKYFHGVQDSDLTEQHLAALNFWATKVGAGLPTCLEKCFAAAGDVPTQACLDQCAATSGHPGGGFPSGGSGGGPTTKPQCPPGMIWDEPTQGCVQPPATGPLPPPPAPIPPETTTPSTASSTGVSSGAGMLIGGAIILAAVAIFAATMKAPGPVKVNPRRRRRTNPKRRKKTPMLVDIQCDTAHGFREFKRIALGGTDPQQMYGYSTADGWQLPDAPEHMSERFHQLLRATGCRVVTIQ